MTLVTIGRSARTRIDDVTFRNPPASQGPDCRSISRFRQRHLATLPGLLTQSLHLAQRLGMAKMGRVERHVGLRRVDGAERTGHFVCLPIVDLMGPK